MDFSNLNAMKNSSLGKIAYNKAKEKENNKIKNKCLEILKKEKVS